MPYRTIKVRLLVPKQGISLYQAAGETSLTKLETSKCKQNTLSIYWRGQREKITVDAHMENDECMSLASLERNPKAGKDRTPKTTALRS